MSRLVAARRATPLWRGDIRNAVVLIVIGDPDLAAAIDRVAATVGARAARAQSRAGAAGSAAAIVVDEPGALRCGATGPPRRDGSDSGRRGRTVGGFLGGGDRHRRSARVRPAHPRSRPGAPPGRPDGGGPRRPAGAGRSSPSPPVGAAEGPQCSAPPWRTAPAGITRRPRSVRRRNRPAAGRGVHTGPALARTAGPQRSSELGRIARGASPSQRPQCCPARAAVTTSTPRRWRRSSMPAGAEAPRWCATSRDN